MADSGGPDEGRCEPSRASERCRAGRSGTGSPAGRRERAGVPVTAEAGPAPFQHDPDEDPAGPGLADRGTVHGFRSAFRDWCAEIGKPLEIAEAGLAHTVAGVEGAYFRSDLLARRRALMDQWAAFLSATDGKVVRLYG